jgi:hypothetical protein
VSPDLRLFHLSFQKTKHSPPATHTPGQLFGYHQGELVGNGNELNLYDRTVMFGFLGDYCEMIHVNGSEMNQRVKASQQAGKSTPDL